MAKKNARKAGAHVKEQKEFEEEVLQIDRVTRVVKGGRRLRFRVTVAIGDKKGRVGIGIGKASEVVAGIQKAVTRAKGNIITVPITDGDTIPHAVNVKYKAVRLLIMPASKGTGVIAGGALRKILNLAGVKNVLSKNIGSRNTLVNAQASIKALQELRPARKAKKFEETKKVSEEDQEDRRPAVVAAEAKAEANMEKDAKKKEKADKPSTVVENEDEKANKIEDQMVDKTEEKVEDNAEDKAEDQAEDQPVEVDKIEDKAAEDKTEDEKG